MNTPASILFVDDDPVISKILQAVLENAGYQVVLAADGRDGLQKAYQHHPDLILADIKMKGMDGHTMRSHVRQFAPYIPIIMLTGVPSQDDKVMSLEEGADAYLTKPFDQRELVATIQAALRRARATETAKQQSRYHDKNLFLDFASRQAHVQQVPVELTPTEWRILACLFRDRDRVVTFQQLLEQVWGMGYGANDRRLLKVHVSNLRRKLGDAGRSPRYIHAVRETGYRFQGYPGTL